MLAAVLIGILGFIEYNSSNILVPFQAQNNTNWCNCLHPGNESDYILID